MKEWVAFLDPLTPDKQQPRAPQSTRARAKCWMDEVDQLGFWGKWRRTEKAFWQSFCDGYRVEGARNDSPAMAIRRSNSRSRWRACRTSRGRGRAGPRPDSARRPRLPPASADGPWPSRCTSASCPCPSTASRRCRERPTTTTTGSRRCPSVCAASDPLRASPARPAACRAIGKIRPLGSTFAAFGDKRRRRFLQGRQRFVDARPRPAVPSKKRQGYLNTNNPIKRYRKKQ